MKLSWVLLGVLFAFLSGRPALAAEPDAPAFSLRIEYVVPVPGHEYQYTITPKGIEVTLHWDEDGPPKAVYRAYLTNDQVKQMTAVLTNTPFATLEPQYSDDTVDDGYEIVFEVAMVDQPPRRFLLRNIHQSNLWSICVAVNALLPNKIRIPG